MNFNGNNGSDYLVLMFFSKVRSYRIHNDVSMMKVGSRMISFIMLVAYILKKDCIAVLLRKVQKKTMVFVVPCLYSVQGSATCLG